MKGSLQSACKEFSANRITILTTFVILAGTLTLRSMLPAEISLLPLYMLICGIPTLVINLRWGTLTAILCSVSVSLTEMLVQTEPFNFGVFCWNLIMRFILLQICVFTVDTIPREKQQD